MDVEAGMVGGSNVIGGITVSVFDSTKALVAFDRSAVRCGDCDIGGGGVAEEGSMKRLLLGEGWGYGFFKPSLGASDLVLP